VMKQGRKLKLKENPNRRLMRNNERNSGKSAPKNR
jgi:hypothetical protein